MSWKEFRTTRGEGASLAQPTISEQNNSNPHPFTNMSRGAGNLALVNAAGTVTITSTSLPWNDTPAIGDEILISGYTNTENNGRFTLTAVTGYTVVFTNASAINETISSSQNLIKWLRTPIKVYQEVVITSGVPTYNSSSASATCTVNPVGGVYAYIVVMNTTDADAIITVSGGTLICPSGGTIGHEVKPFNNAVSGVAATATTGTLYINIS
jgi:hypothetical protein